MVSGFYIPTKVDKNREWRTVARLGLGRLEQSRSGIAVCEFTPHLFGGSYVVPVRPEDSDLLSKINPNALREHPVSGEPTPWIYATWWKALVAAAQKRGWTHVSEQIEVAASGVRPVARVERLNYG